MKLSFALPSKSSSKPKPTTTTFSDVDGQHNQPSKEFVTQFDATKPLADSKPKYIIPPKENEWRPHKKMRNIGVALQSDGTRQAPEFELESPSDADLCDDKISYGLNLREGGVASQTVPVEQLMLQSFRNDMDKLPEDRGFEEFDEVPVEGFGAALLAGYGWYEGRGIGKNAKEDVKVKQYERRSNKEGLGFFDDDSKKLKESREKSDKSRQIEKPVEIEKPKEMDEEDRFFVGKDVRVIEGRDMGLKARIVKKLDVDWVTLRILKSEQEIRVRVVDIAELGSMKEDRCLKKLKESKIKEENYHKDHKQKRESKKRSKDHEEVKIREDHRKNGREQQSKGSRDQVPWLMSHIRVRIISSDLKGGKFYLMKGEVVDVVGPTTCDISMDESGERIQGVDQQLLETALPRRGGAVLVLQGKHKGVYGSLVEKDLDREIGVVRDADSHELLNVRLEQIAEYVGDPTYIGY